MTYLDAAHQVLKEAKEPLHYQEITRRSLSAGLIAPTGQTPEATMGSRLYTDTLQEGSRFVRAGKGFFELAQWQPSGIDAQIQTINDKTRAQLHELLLKMPPARFEALITELLIQMGFDESTVETTPYSKDGGIDVRGIFRAAGLTDVNAAVQVKRWKRTVGSKEVTQLRGSLEVRQQGIIITTSDFSKPAVEEANAPGKTRISLINGGKLLELLIKHKVGVAEKHLITISLDDEWWGELLGTDMLTPEAVLGDSSASTSVMEPTERKVSGVKPHSFTFDGQSYSVSSWKELLITVCYLLAQRHGPAFESDVDTIRGKKRIYFARSPESMTDPTLIPGTNIWAETNFNADSILKLVDQLFSRFGYRPDEFEIVVPG